MSRIDRRPSRMSVPGATKSGRAKRVMNVQQALEWAFRIERAQLELPERPDSEPPDHFLIRLTLSTGRSRTLATITLGLTHPIAKTVWRIAQFACNRSMRCCVASIFVAMLRDKPHRACALRRGNSPPDCFLILVSQANTALRSSFDSVL